MKRLIILAFPLIVLFLQCGKHKTNFIAIINFKISPNESFVSFSGYEKSLLKSVFVLNIHNRELRKIAKGDEYDWHPDNQHIFISNRTGIYKIDTASGNQQELFPNQYPYFCHNITCAPNGNELLFVSSFSGDNPEIFTLYLDNLKVKQLTNNTVEDNFPQWSRDAGKITYLSNNKPTIMNADGTNKLILLNKISDSPPVSSPSGGEVAVTLLVAPEGSDGSTAFTMNKSGTIKIDKRQMTSAIFVVNIDGSKLEEITNGFDPRWNVDGKKLMFQYQAGELPEVYVYDILQNRFHNLLPAPRDSTFAISSPQWFTTSDRIAFVALNEYAIPNGIGLINSDGTEYERLISF